MNDVLIPLVPGEKKPLVRWAGDNPNMAEWWESAPADANVGLRLDNYLVVDCDSPEAAAWYRANWVQPTDVRVKTPKGEHFYYRLPENMTVANPGPIMLGNHNGDLKSGPGHYVVIPPSATASGAYRPLRPYSQLEPISEIAASGHASEGRVFLPIDAPVIAPEAIQSVNAYRPTPIKGLPSEYQPTSDPIPEGMRNHKLTSLAGHLRRENWPEDAIYRMVLGVNNQIAVPPLPAEEVQAIVKSVMRYEPNPSLPQEAVIEIVPEGQPEAGKVSGIRLLRSKDMAIPPSPEFVIPFWLPSARLTQVDGEEGLGKGLFCADTAVKYTKGELGKQGNVLWLAAEDDPEEDIKRRLVAAGQRPDDPHDVLFVDSDEQIGFPGDIKGLVALIHQENVGLVIMDPGRSYLQAPPGSKEGWNDDRTVRHGLMALQRMAHKEKVAIIFVHHWNKNTATGARQRSSGSGAFSQTVRHRISMAKVGQEPYAVWAMEVNKTNVGKAGGLTAYEVEEVPQYDTARFVWGERLPSFSGLDEWIHHQQQNQGGINVDPRDAADLALAKIAVGSPVDRQWLQDNAGISKREADEVLTQLKKEDKIARTKQTQPYLWLGE